jgi:aerobic carbon-monoxide dehydrogenase medium subunit
LYLSFDHLIVDEKHVSPPQQAGGLQSGGTKMKWPAFEYARATDLDDLWRLRETLGPDAKLLAGGQSLLATLAFRLSQPSALIDITGIAVLKGVSDLGHALRIGALTRHVDLERSELIRVKAPLLREAAPLIAHAAIRNRGTLGGSLAYADPAAELPACMVALGGVIIALSPAGERRIPAGAFFTGLFETALAEDEIIAAVEVPVRTAQMRTSITELTRRCGDYAMAGLALALTMDGDAVGAARLVYFGVGSGPVLARAASAELAGQPLSVGAIAKACAALDADLDPPVDLHGPPAMKRHLARVLTERALMGCLPAERAAA